MNFTLEISASPALLEVLQSLAASFAKPGAVAESATTKAPVPATTKAAQTDLPVQETELPALSLEQLRALTIEKSRSGSNDAVRQLLTGFNVAKLTDLPVSDYAAFYQQISAL
jgi:hypothetical protein